VPIMCRLLPLPPAMPPVRRTATPDPEGAPGAPLGRAVAAEGRAGALETPHLPM